MENKEKLINEGNNYIVLENINKIYPNGVQAVYDFSLDIKKHEFIVFVGPSGCGKSTTLRMVAGLEEITSGKLFIDGKYANDLTPKNRDIAMVFQSYALYPQMSVYNNLAFGLKMRKIEEPILDENNNQVKRIDENKIKKIQKEIKIIEKDIHKLDVLIEKNPEEERYISLKDEVLLNLKSKKESLDYYSNNEVPAYRMRHYTKAEIDVKVKEAAKILQIEQYLYSKPSELSGGQRQRVALGRAIVRNAKVFLMDEPLSNLDAKLRVNMRSEIIELHNKINSTTIYVTHDQTEAMTMADRIVVMKDGYIQQIGTPKEIYNKPSNLFVATFIGSPAMNILKGVIKKNKLILTDDFKIDLSKDQKESIKKFYQNEIVNLTSINESIDQNIKEELEEKKSSLQAKKSKEKVLLLNKTLNDNKEKIERYNAYLKEDEYEIFFGIRPEDILQASKKNETSSKEIKLIVKIPELLGNEYYIHSEFAGQMITSKIQSKDMIYVGDELNIVFDLDRFNIFDRISEKGIL